MKKGNAEPLTEDSVPIPAQIETDSEASSDVINLYELDEDQHMMLIQHL